VSRKGSRDSGGLPDERSAWWRLPGRGAMLSLLSLIGLIVLAAGGLERLRGRVDALPEYTQSLKLELADPPPWVVSERWLPQILGCVDLPPQASLLDGGVVRRVGETLTASGWVSRVRRVTRELDGTIRAWCEYRRPIAMVRTGRGDDGEYRFVAVDKDGVRLPQIYKNVTGAGWMQIVGIESVEKEEPPTGSPLVGDDAQAAVKLAGLLFEQPFATQVETINVSNFRGRRDKRSVHIYLTFVAPGPRPESELTGEESGAVQRRTFLWGSAIGEEIDEPNCQEKVRLILKWLESDTTHARVDGSIFPDRVVERVQPPVSTADGSTRRNR